MWGVGHRGVSAPASPPGDAVALMSSSSLPMKEARPALWTMRSTDMALLNCCTMCVGTLQSLRKL